RSRGIGRNRWVVETQGRCELLQVEIIATTPVDLEVVWTIVHIAVKLKPMRYSIIVVTGAVEDAATAGHPALTRILIGWTVSAAARAGLGAFPRILRWTACGRCRFERVRWTRARRSRAALGCVTDTSRRAADGGRGLEPVDALPGAVAGIRRVTRPTIGRA